MELIAWERIAALLIASVAMSGCATSTERFELEEFRAIEPMQVELAYLFSKEHGAFVGNLVERGPANCLDLRAANEAVEAELLRFDNYPEIIIEEMPATLRITVDAEVEIPASRGSYFFWQGVDGLLISSSAWYFQDGEQIFLSCPVRPIAWRIYRVSAVEPLNHSPAE